MKIRPEVLSLPIVLLALAGNSASVVLPTEPLELVMQGSPPPEDRVVNRINQIQPENLRWSLTHMRMLLPTANISRGDGPVAELPQGQAFSPPSFTDADGTTIDFDAWMRRSHADTLLILHKGKIVFEGYAPGVDPSVPHTIQSVSKSFIGTVAAMMVGDGQIDPNLPLARYVPELAASAWGTATVQESLDMTVGVRYNEDIKDPNSDVRRYYGVATGTYPPPPDYDGPKHIYAMLERLPTEGAHGKAFTYKTVNPEAVAWAVARVSGKRPSEVISERIWTQLGVEKDAYVSVDPVGSEMMGGGMSVTTRDLARFGEMLRLDGKFNGKQIIAQSVVADLFKGGDLEKFKADPQRRAMVGYSYHNFWWKPPEEGVMEALGGFGQHIHINKKAETVIIKLSSAAIGAPYDEARRLDARAFAAIDGALARK